MRRIFMITGLGLLGTWFAAPQAAAQGWQDDTPGQRDRAFYTSRSDGRSLQLGCFGGADGLRFTLIGGAAALPASARQARGVMVWITLPDGRTGRYPLDTEYMDNALIGTLLLGREGLAFLAGGQTISVTDPSGAELFRSGMRGTSAAVADFRNRCGL